MVNKTRLLTRSFVPLAIKALDCERETSFNFQDLGITVETAQRDISRKKNCVRVG